LWVFLNNLVFCNQAGESFPEFSPYQFRYLAQEKKGGYMSDAQYLASSGLIVGIGIVIVVFVAGGAVLAGLLNLWNNRRKR
jgi:hypothetical protein